MPHITKTVLSSHSAEQMYDLVTSVKDYPHFLPWCGGVDIHEQQETLMEATIHINFKGLHQKFRTQNHQNRPHSIEMNFVEGPFQHFTGNWQFKPLGDAACKIEFSLHYEFSSTLLEKLIGPVFSYIANTFVDAFIKRAETVYGK